MKLLSWNCQGLGNPLTVKSLKALVAKERPDIIFLMETKNQEVAVQWVRMQLRYPNSVLMNPIGLAGGMALFRMINFILQWTDLLRSFLISYALT